MIKEVALILTIIIGAPDKPNVTHAEPMEDIVSCFAAAKEFLAIELTEQMRQSGAVGKAAMCAYKEKPSQAN